MIRSTLKPLEPSSRYTLDIKEANKTLHLDHVTRALAQPDIYEWQSSIRPKFDIPVEPLLPKDKGVLDGAPILNAVLYGRHANDQWYHALALDELARQIAEDPDPSRHHLEGKELEFIQKGGYAPLLQKKVRVWERILNKDPNDLTEKVVTRFGSDGDGYIGVNENGAPVVEDVKRQNLAQTFERLTEFAEQMSKKEFEGDRLTKSERHTLLANAQNALSSATKKAPLSGAFQRLSSSARETKQQLKDLEKALKD